MPGLTLDANGTQTLLAEDAVFTGTGTYVGNYNTITVMVKASHASATNGLSMQFSTNNSDWDSAATATVSAATLDVTVLHVVAPFFRIVYTNGGTASTYMRMSALASTASMPAALTL